MRLEFEVEVPDAPGELTKVLEAVARFGGNVLSVVHRHETLRDGHVAVVVAAEVPEAAALRLADALARTHRLLRLNREGGPVQATVLLVGHVFEAGMTDLVNAVFETGGEVAELDARLNGRANPSAVLARLSAADEGALQRGVATLRALADQHRLLFVEQVIAEGDA